MFKKQSSNNSNLLLSSSSQGSPSSVQKFGLLNFSYDTEDGTLRCGNCLILIGNKNCYIIAVIFGGIFILVGGLLLFISTKANISNEKLQDTRQPNDNSGDLKNTSPSETHIEAQIIGILLVIIGILLSVTGCIIKLIYWNFSPRRNGNLHNVLMKTNNSIVAQNEIFGSIEEDVNINNEANRKNSNISNLSNGSSIFVISPNILQQRRATLPIVDFLNERKVGLWKEVAGSVTPDAETQISVSTFKLDLPNPIDSNGTSLNPSPHRKASLSFRPSLPEVITSYFSHHSQPVGKLNKNFLSRSRSVVIPINELQKTKSDIPFGSIASLHGNGDIACFPKKNQPILKRTIPEIKVLNENGSPASAYNSELDKFNQPIPVTPEEDFNDWILYDINKADSKNTKQADLTEITII